MQAWKAWSLRTSGFESQSRRFNMKKIIAIVKDIIFKSKIIATAKNLNREVVVLKNYEDIQKNIDNTSLIIIDLNFSEINPLKIIKKLKQDNIKIIGYLSHIQTELKEKALEAGCDEVMPRSQFSMNLDKILS